LTGINSQITAINAQANTFTAQTPDGFTFTFGSNGSTAFQGVAAFSTLSIGVLVNLNAAIQRDGSFLATRVEVDDLGALATNTGPTEVGPNSQTGQFYSVTLQQQGCVLTGNPIWGGLFQFLGTTTFATSGEF
jgi:hypothetical protein